MNNRKAFEGSRVYNLGQVVHLPRGSRAPLDTPETSLLRFGAFELDPKSGKLRKADLPP